MRDRFRLYDNGGKTIDRYTLIDAKPHDNVSNDNSGWVVWHDYIAFNSEPFHPQGFGQHGEYERIHSDRLDLRHLGRRISLDALPEQARRFAEQFIRDCCAT